MATLERTAAETCAAASAASAELAVASADDRNRALKVIERLLDERREDILAANAADLGDPRAEEMSAALRDRLTLDSDRITSMVEGVRAVAELEDPLGEVLDQRTLASGLELTKVTVPLGVVAVIYEARPNVTVDCAALTIKSGNSVVLRGSSYAERSNAALAGLVRDALAEVGLAADAVALVPSHDPEALRQVAQAEGVVDLLIPRGGDGLKETIQEVATVPVMYAAAGNCHVYVHSDADLEKARSIAVNAKVDRPGVCNAAETLLVDSAVARDFLPAAVADLQAQGVELRGDERVRSLVGSGVAPAGPEDWDTEYLDLTMAVSVVDSLADAVSHINRHGSGHSEAIVTESPEVGAIFAARVDAAAVYINASTRFTDGYEFGMGAEIGNSTQKLHARGPIGVRELTTFKYVVRGDGQIRE